MLRKIILHFSFLFFAGNIFSQETLTIEQAIEIAMKNNFDIRIAQNDAEVAAINNNIGNAGMLPKLNATLTDNYSLTNLHQVTVAKETETNNVSSNTIASSLNFSWTLFDGMKMFATKARLKRLEQIGQLNLKDTLQLMIAQVIEGYYDVVSAQQQLRSINEAIALYEETVKLTEKQFQVGTSSKAAYLQAKVDLNANKSAALTQRKLIEQKKASFNFLLTRPAETDFNVVDSIPFNANLPVVSPNELDSKNFQIQIAAKGLEISRYAKKEVFSQLLPNLTIGANGSSAGYGFTKTKNSDGFSLLNQSYGPNVGFTLTVPLFNGLIYLHQLKVAKISIMNNEFKLQKVSLQNKINFYNALKDFETAKEALTLETENIAYAKENVDIAFSRFRLSQSIAIELRQAQQSYVDAMTRLVTARFNAKTAETELMRIQGELVK